MTVMHSEKELLDKQKPITGELIQGQPEDHDHEEFHEYETSFPDISHYSKEELVKELQALRIEGNLSRVGAFLRDIKLHYDELVQVEKNEALEQFLQEGGAEEDFELKKTDTDLAFEKFFSRLRNEHAEKSQQLENEKEKNLKEKLQILEKLRELTSSEESSLSLGAFKELQNEWKNSGPVPAARTKELWANYNALVEMFYNNRSIYFELKELDRKKNLESKNEIVEKAEKLSLLENIPEAIRELRKLHEEYKSIGPVPKEEQEALWNRFKEASDKVYHRRNELLEKNRKSEEENLKLKEALIEKAKEFASFQTPEINAWKEKTQEILGLQAEWKKVGPVTKDKTKEISKEFWSSYKAFFKSKDIFFRELEHQKKENLQKKIELCEKAEALKDIEDIDGTTEEVKRLQAEWAQIGPVPVKQKEEIFKRFKAACDHFFNRKREQFAEQEKEYEVNLKNKLAIIEKIEELAGEKAVPEQMKTLQKEFNSIGFVPKKDIKLVKERYKEAVEKYLSKMDGVEGEGKEKMKLELEVSVLKADPNSKKKLHRKESDILRRIQQLRNDIKTFNTNIDFLANSPKADKLKVQVQKNIEAAESELNGLEEQLNIIRKTK